MSNLVDMIGKRFGMATVVSRAGTNRQGEAMWQCLCDCGNKFITRGANLRTGNTKSCGCYMAISASKQFKTHGMTKSRIYYIWSSMKQRCTNERCKEFRFYGHRGIGMCAEWMKFEAFARWAFENGYQENLTIERMDCNGNYEPCNCTFIPLREQGRNTRTVLRITTPDGYVTATEAAELLKVSHSTIERIFRLEGVSTIDDIIRVLNERKEKHAKTYSYWQNRKRS